MDEVLARFDQIVQQRPDDLCLDEGEVRYSFIETQRISDGLALELSQLCKHPNQCVAWIGGSGASRLLAYLAIQKAGLVFFAPNITQTDEQIAQMLEVANPALILTDQEHEHRAGLVSDVQTLATTFATTDITFERPVLPKDALSHLTMTSGSTGTPKILPRTRTDMGYFVDLACKLQSLTHSDTTALLGNLWNPTQFTGLYSGARTACFDVPRWGATDLADWMATEKITTVMMYPAIFRELMSAQVPLPNLRCIILIGEPLTRDDAEIHARICAPDSELVNIYGSMEFPYLLEWRRKAGDEIDFETMPMGKEVVPGEMHLVDENGETLPDGATGEIEITSNHVPNLYLDNPELSEERIRTLPDGRTGFRMGDFAYRDYLGIYHTMGRRDQQTKIRGYNVRPTDVELIIKQQPNIQECVVTTEVAANGVRKLVCFYVGDSSTKQLRSSLKHRLPNYMIPSVWRRLDKLPKTHAGKVKRDALPNPFLESSGHKFRSNSEAEASLGRLFTQILGTEEFQSSDDFFDLGGDSLQAMRLVTECGILFGRRPPFESLILNGASIDDLVHFIMTDDSPSPIVLRKGNSSNLLITAHTHDGNLWAYLPFSQALDPQYRVVGTNGHDGIATCNGHRTIQELARHSCDILATEIQNYESVTFVGYSFGGAVAAEMARIAHEDYGTRAQLVLFDTAAIWRARLAWLRRILAEVRKLDFSGFWDICKMYISTRNPAFPLKFSGTQLIAWFSYNPQTIPIERVLYVCAKNKDAHKQAELWQQVLDGPMDTVNTTSDHLDMMNDESARILAQQIQSWVET